MSRMFVVFGSILLLLVVLSWLGVASPELALAHYEEDQTIEYLTAAVFFAAACAGLVGLWRRRFRDAWLWAVSGLAVLATLDELSFGERHVGTQPPMVGGVWIDGAHDFLDVGYRYLERRVDRPDLLLLGAGVIALVVGWWVLSRLIGYRRLAGWLALRREHVYLGAACVLVGLAQLLDLNLQLLDIDLIWKSYVEEHLELSAGILTLVFVLARMQSLETARGQLTASTSRPPSAGTAPADAR